MENYTKYRLKEIDELAPFLAETDKIFVVACNKCFKEFETVDEPDCGEFVKLAEAQGKTVTGSVQVDFLCNKTQTEKKLKDLIPEGTKSVFVVSCGLGVQTIASMVDLPVYAAANSLNYRGHHGMALTKKSCDACAQCYLNMTGGVCPIVDCAKSLVNGQCGGAKNGKCEVDPNKDCAWEKINKRLSQQCRLGELNFGTTPRSTSRSSRSMWIPSGRAASPVTTAAYIPPRIRRWPSIPRWSGSPSPIPWSSPCPSIPALLPNPLWKWETM